MPRWRRRRLARQRRTAKREECLSEILNLEMYRDMRAMLECLSKPVAPLNVAGSLLFQPVPAEFPYDAT